MSTRAKEGPVNGGRRYDPRLGDEDDSLPTPLHVRIPDNIAHPGEGSEKQRKPPARPRPDTSPKISITTRIAKLLPFNLGWIPANLTWSKLKPVIRCAVVCWVSTLLLIIGPTGRVFGMVSRYIYDCDLWRRRVHDMGGEDLDYTGPAMEDGYCFSIGWRDQCS